MSHGQFLFFLAKDGQTLKLSKEIDEKFNGLKLSFQKENFLTYKNYQTELSLDEISATEVPSCLSKGICLGPIEKKNEKESIENYLVDFQIAAYTISRWTLNSDIQSGDSPINNNFVFDIIEIDDENCWIGIHIE